MTPTNRVSRRGLLAGGLALGAGALLTPAARAAGRGWPRGPITGAAARAVDPAKFMPRWQIHEWQEAADGIGLRATGSTAHHGYVDGLAARMERVGISAVTAEGVPFDRWQPSSWSLDVVGGHEAGPVEVAGYLPYSGDTGPDGVTARLCAIPMPGTIGIVSVASPPLPYLLLDVIDWDAPLQPRHAPGYNPLDLYARPWLSTESLIDTMSAFEAAGAVGLIVVLDEPAEAARGRYAPYDGVVRDLPALYVDRNTGAGLRKVALAGGKARLKLEAGVRTMTTPNVYGVIPGASDELVVLSSHTDGTHGLEENGPEAILAIAQYLARIPRDELPRSILVLMSTGHLAGTSPGTTEFLRRHADDLVARTAAAMSLEHLGARPWLPGPDGEYEIAPGYEPGVVFSSPHVEMVKAGRRAQDRQRIGDNRVLRPFKPDPTLSSPSGFWWPGDGEPLWRTAGLPSLQYISGPTYLLNAGMPTMRFVDTAVIRRQAIAFTDATLELVRMPRSRLDKRRLDDPSTVLDLLRALLPTRS
ncbi:PA domain protein [Amycolatopsis cihanbeyliensis]|uniref:PA domain-containing protein n=1 Tax=Amycolatopsis cihanbeyliensis TaxID=1128664 RepID=A0A542DS39_AMYCI|nr:PA domain protein [Amycolatopsis cihanbeyliensis]TQJ05937.1 hypothetical protein FB471_5784 [Amycolatopsis cihanbeyliensis]